VDERRHRLVGYVAALLNPRYEFYGLKVVPLGPEGLLPT